MQGGPYTAGELFEQVAQAGAVAHEGCGAARFDFFDAPCLETTIGKALSCAGAGQHADLARFGSFGAPCLETTISKALSDSAIAGAVILELFHMLEVASAGSLQGLAALRRRWSVCRLGGLNRVQRGPHTAEELSWQVAQAGAVAPKGLRCCSVRLLWRAMPGAPLPAP